ncbi:MAG: zinc-dependent alcohol dehydrogenase family protein [Rhodospirillales bacterium]|nr:zinc-dependent alcohol dehydrogenase family protein [Rhodospirillales bacterium]
MKSVIFYEPGGPEVLKLVELPDPVAGRGEVLIRTRAMAVSMPDVLIRTGVYKWSPPLPASPGNELTGIVEAIGEDVTEFQPGQPVLLSARELSVRGGCYTELIAVSERSVHALPDDVDFERAAVLPTYVVAHAMLHGLGIAASAQSIFVTGAAGSVAGALTDLAKAGGITVIGSVSSEAKAEYARAQGVDHIVYYKDEPVAERVMALTDGRGVDASFDHAIGDNFVECVHMLADFGTAIAYNVFNPMPDKDIFGELRELSSKSAGVRVFNIHTLDSDQPVLRKITREVIDMLGDGKIQPSVGARLPMSEAAEAHRLLEGGEVLGKIVLTA